MSSTITLSNGQVIAYSYHYDSPLAPTLVLASSLSAPSDVWDSVIPQFISQGFSILRYNQPGHGDSTVPKGTTTFNGIAESVKELMDLLEIKHVAAWIGVSMGAATGVVFAGKFPGVIRKLVICDTIEGAPVVLGQDNIFEERVQSARADGDMQKTVELVIDRWFGQEWVAANPEEAKRVRAVMNETKVDGFAACCQALTDASFDLRPIYKQLGASVEDVLLVVGEKDGDLPTVMEGMRAKIEEGFGGKKIELKVVKNAGHVCFIDGKDGFLMAVEPFITA